MKVNFGLWTPKVIIDGIRFNGYAVELNVSRRYKSILRLFLHFKRY